MSFGMKCSFGRYDNVVMCCSFVQIPAPVMNISTDNHPVKLGISDAFYMDYTQNGELFYILSLFFVFFL